MKNEEFAEKINSLEQQDRELILKALNWTGENSPDTKTGAASILLDLQMDSGAVIAALLSDGLKDKDELEKISAVFGAETSGLVKNAAGISGLSAKNKTIHEAENIRNMLFVMTEDIRVILIKLAEMLCNMRMQDEAPTEQRKILARECLDIYAPLAGRLGIFRIKDEMEDLSLKFLNREIYQRIKDIVAAKRTQRAEFLSLALEALGKETEKAGIKVDVDSRAKHFYSIYTKMRKHNKSAEEIYDLSGIRIVCENIEQCYTLLGIVHRLWKPVGGRFKDYIAMPKPNGYRSLHTTVSVAGGENFPGEERMLEIQIRTMEMHQVAQNGVASHWLYKKGSSRELVKPSGVSIADRGAAASWLEEIKREILKKSIYVFTPQGKVIELSAGATPIDFAYSVHSAVGDHCIGAKANGSIIPLDCELKNTQVIEILTSTQAHPHFNWLSIAKTSKARNKIRSWLKKNDDSIIIEKNVMAKKKPVVQEFARDTETQPIQVVQVSPADASPVRIEREKNMMINFARCCNPVTGDDITGYVSRGRGIIIHRKNCSNLANIPDIAQRQVEAEWENSSSVLVRRFRIEAKLQANLFSEIEGAVRKRRGHLIEGRLEESGGSRLAGFFTMRLEQAEDLKAALKNIRNIPGILSLRSLN